jgi:hypothetical protein
MRRGGAWQRETSTWVSVGAGVGAGVREEGGGGGGAGGNRVQKPVESLPPAGSGGGGEYGVHSHAAGPLLRGGYGRGAGQGHLVLEGHCAGEGVEGGAVGPGHTRRKHCLGVHKEGPGV